MVGIHGPKQHGASYVWNPTWLENHEKNCYGKTQLRSKNPRRQALLTEEGHNRLIYIYLYARNGSVHSSGLERFLERLFITLDSTILERI